MNKALRNWPFLIVAILLTAAVIAFVYNSARPRYGTAARLVGLLPQSDAVLFYADITALRHSGFLNFLGTAKSAEDPDYQRFVAETGFAYQRDLDAIAVASVPNQLFAVARGRFNWQRLIQYAGEHGGHCKNRFCQSPASQRGKWISFFPVRSDIIGVAVSADANAAYELSPREGVPDLHPPDFPVWAEVPRRILDQPDSLPPAVQVLARALSSAASVTIGISQAPSSGPGSALNIRLIAVCDSEIEANNVRDHLTQLTTMFRNLIARNQPPSTTPDLARLFTSGVFLTKGKNVDGDWIVPRPVVDSLFQ
ncbi:MAG: hypothetical protein WB676_11180 [Bryobacteraceae bacterium]